MALTNAERQRKYIARLKAAAKAAERLNANRPPFHACTERAVKPEEIDEATIDAVLAEEEAEEAAEARRREQWFKRITDEVRREAWLDEKRREAAKRRRDEALAKIYGPRLTTLAERQAIHRRAKAKLRGR